MTRATLLHVLERPTALGPAEVRELEQLAQAFPYCQTAHLLLAKAAHDQGTMLAGQRLRRAATYAADRTLLRRLIEQEEPAVAPESAPVVLPAPPHPLDLVDWPDEYVPPTAPPPVAPPLPAAATPSVPVPVETLPPVAVAPAAPLAPVAEVPAATVETPVAPVASPLPEFIALPEPAPAPISEPVVVAVAPPVSAAPHNEAAVVAVPAAAIVPVALAQAENAIAATIAAEVPEIAPPALPAATAVEAPAPVPQTMVAEPELQPMAAVETVALVAPIEGVEAPAAPLPPAEPLPAPAVIASAAIPEAAPDVPSVEIPNAPATTSATVEAISAVITEEPEAELPPQAPAIRPPVEVGEARFEFGLADPAPATAVPTYELPGLVDEWAASAVTRSLGSPEALTPAAPVPVVPAFTPAAFTGDAVVGYAFGESSRLGLSMQLLDLLAAKAEAAESATAVVAAAQPPAMPLPPVGTFFEPDPLLLDHWATHRPAAPELPSTVDLINNFLKRQPRLTRPAMLPPAPGGQADLSVRSTRAEPDLVSENLARIFVRQGKTARAIEIYEKLMVKQPEKMAYFALQIQSLQPSA